MDKDTIAKIIGYAIATALVAGGGTVGFDKVTTNQDLVRQDIYETRHASRLRLERLEAKLDACIQDKVGE